MCCSNTACCDAQTLLTDTRAARPPRRSVAAATATTAADAAKAPLLSATMLPFCWASGGPDTFSRACRQAWAADSVARAILRRLSQTSLCAFRLAWRSCSSVSGLGFKRNRVGVLRWCCPRRVCCGGAVLVVVVVAMAANDVGRCFARHDLVQVTPLKKAWQDDKGNKKQRKSFRVGISTAEVAHTYSKTATLLLCCAFFLVNIRNHPVASIHEPHPLPLVILYKCNKQNNSYIFHLRL